MSRPPSSAAAVQREVDALADAGQAKELQRFFKTGPGDYGEGDVFIGVKVPPLRKIARAHRGLALGDLERLLESPVHEHRTVALVIMTERAARASAVEKKELYDFYLAHTDRINNWDLVDISCREIVGEHLRRIGDWSPLRSLAQSQLIWDRRIAIVSTWAMIRADQLDPTFAISKQLLGDSQDLIHKATGWMLREAGKRDLAQLEGFLAEHASAMPRTALRYAIERMTPERRAYWRSF